MQREPTEDLYPSYVKFKPCSYKTDDNALWEDMDCKEHKLTFKLVKAEARMVRETLE